jgi:hypothetical protein
MTMPECTQKERIMAKQGKLWPNDRHFHATTTATATAVADGVDIRASP